MMGEFMPEGGPIVAVISGNLNPAIRMAHAQLIRRASRACPEQLSGLGQPHEDHHFDQSGGRPMFDFQDLFQWDRFITPTIIKTFYWLVIGLIVLFGISGIFSGLAAMAISPFGGFILLLSSIASVVVGVVFSRIVAEFILIVFRINEHLGAIRSRGEM
jgi:hypothetical protein